MLHSEFIVYDEKAPSGSLSSIIAAGVYCLLAQNFWNSMVSSTKTTAPIEGESDGLFLSTGGTDINDALPVESVDAHRLLVECQHGVEVTKHVADASWWEWTRGSALVFWRWGQYQQLALEGFPPLCWEISFTLNGRLVLHRLRNHA
jgi:hypothetical protein